ncbi:MULTISPECIES: ferritin-like domain-containing protein [Dyella]|uniref:Ferritin-like domain-containing protein n=2 Tax=Dyella TaxID=231454 RepID=A0A4R0YVF1_9GAMM|nr:MULTISPECIES: ferritin-like domain-containing protein [Dyella]TBR39090.1 ferritin-like domain-containing protein [Dyella terrae]TCI13322.1 ferritin-like domain-containing protein [Dyella soli]
MSDLHQAARRCLEAADPAEKLRLTHEAWQQWLAGELTPSASSPPPSPMGAPGRPALPRLVPQRQVPHRGLGTEEGRAALVHAVAHIEFNAINLAWDAVYRFRDMPLAYYHDWASCAHDEARHFAMLSKRLADMGHAYGDFDAHNGLWEMAEKTAHHDTARMALVPRVLEARGLDVTPGMIERLLSVGDQATVAVLEVILREEVAHVAAGTRWFRHCCQRDGVDPRQTFLDLLQTYMGRTLRGPFNRPARLEAGFDEQELDRLTEMALLG